MEESKKSIKYKISLEKYTNIVVKYVYTIRV